MSSASDTSGSGVSVSSIGWLDDDGRSCLRDVATQRLWVVKRHGGYVAMLALPTDVDALDVLVLACRMLDTPPLVTGSFVDGAGDPIDGTITLKPSGWGNPPHAQR